MKYRSKKYPNLVVEAHDHDRAVGWVTVFFRGTLYSVKKSHLEEFYERIPDDGE